MLGYRIKWRGINSEQAEVSKDPKNSESKKDSKDLIFDD